MKAAIYCRVSTEEQAQAGTIDAQVQFARRYCDLNQVQIVEWYLDDGVTGTIPISDRPSGKRLMGDAKAGRFETVLVYRVDRFGR